MNYFKELLHQKGSRFICNLINVINVNAQLKNTDFVGEGRTQVLPATCEASQWG